MAAGMIQFFRLNFHDQYLRVLMLGWWFVVASICRGQAPQDRKTVDWPVNENHKCRRHVHLYPNAEIYVCGGLRDLTSWRQRTITP
jgi:hypothetical protein